jgi:hypothetical protein
MKEPFTGSSIQSLVMTFSRSPSNFQKGESMRRLRSAAVAFAIALTALTGAFSTASAAPVDGAVKIARPQGISSPKSNAVANTICSDVFNGQLANYICEYGVTFAKWNDGSNRGHNFLIGTNYQVYNQLQYPNGTWSTWNTLGGQARSGVTSYAYSTYIVIKVVGTNGGHYCKSVYYSVGSWSNWYACTP